MVSVVIPVYNEEKLIQQCLDSLAHQRTTKKFEVILVDNISTDRTVDIAKGYNNTLHLKIVSEKTKGRGAARKRGFDEANGTIILSTDADTVVPSDWVETLSGVLEKSHATAVTGTCKIADCDGFINTLFNYLQPLAMRIYRLVFGHYWLSGFNFGISADVYEKSGGFNAQLNAQEDIDLSFRVGKLGTIRFLPDMPVTSSGRRFRNGLLQGLLPYLSTFTEKFFYKRENVVMSDIR